MNRIIELIGLPGAGKTTLLQRLVQLNIISSQNIIQPGKPGRLRFGISLLTLVSRMLLHSPGSFVRLGSRSDGRWLISKLAYRRGNLVIRGGQRGISADCGLLQPLVSFAAEYAHGPVNLEDLLKIYNCIHRPDAIIYIETGAELSHQRYLHRQRMTGRRPDAVVSVEAFLRAEMLCQQIVESFDSARVLRIDFEGIQGESCVSDMRNRVRNWLDSQRG